MNYQGKCAFVTGVAHGIGRAIALGFAKGQCDLALADIDEAGLAETAEKARAFGVRVETYKLDVTDEAAVNASVADAIAKLGKIDILVNNAGVYSNCKRFVDLPVEVWKRKFEINVYGTFYATRAVIPGMKERHYGRIIHIGSVAGMYGIASMADYSATKGAIIAFTHALAKELAPEGITVNCVSPGSIDVRNDKNAMPEHSFTGRAGTPEECAAVVLFLASDEASYVCGQNYAVDGCRKKM